MMQEAIVAVIVICAAFVVIKRYAPKAVKRIARSWSARTAIRFGRHALAAKIERQALAGASCGNGCGACSNCGSKSNATAVENQLPSYLEVGNSSIDHFFQRGDGANAAPIISLRKTYRD